MTVCAGSTWPPGCGIDRSDPGELGVGLAVVPTDRRKVGRTYVADHTSAEPHCRPRTGADVHDGGVDARALVVNIGDRITTWGRIWHHDGADWADQHWISGLMFEHAPQSGALRLIGADLSVVEPARLSWMFTLPLASTPTRAPRCLGSAAMVSIVSDAARNSRS